MKRFYRITLLMVVLIFSSTYNPQRLNTEKSVENNFFQIKYVNIYNNNLIKEETVKDKLRNIYNKNIFLVKKKYIEESLNEVYFLEKFEVKKKYPDTIEIKIFETKPLAILIKNKNKYLIDNKSNLISINNNENFNYLPFIFGEDVEKNFTKFYYQLSNNNFPTENIKSFYFFQIGRWDLHLLNGKIIKLPSKNKNDSINTLIQLLNRKDFEKYNIIDLRVEGKIIVE